MFDKTVYESRYCLKDHRNVFVEYHFSNSGSLYIKCPNSACKYVNSCQVYTQPPRMPKDLLE